MNQKTTKRQYRIRNWREYNAALKQRGSLTLWIDEDALQNWRSAQKSGRRGASRTYSDRAIMCALTLQLVYHLPLRATEGLLASLFDLMQIRLPVMDYSTLSRRRRQLTMELSVSLSSVSRRGGIHLVVDASGFKVYGEGEWKVRQHGWSKRRTWRKLHIGVNEQNGEILTAIASTNDFRDDELLGDLLEPLEDVKLKQVSGDGIYDSRRCYRLLQKRRVCAAIPPRHQARLADLTKKPELAQRNAHIQRIASLEQQGHNGRKKWKEEVGYHRRSLAETTFFRLKTLFPTRLSSRSFEAQASELLLRCAVLNRMTQLGMPHSYPL